MRVNPRTLRDIDPETEFDRITSDYDNNVYILIIPTKNQPTLYTIKNAYGIYDYTTPDKNLALWIMADMEGQLIYHRLKCKKSDSAKILKENRKEYKNYKRYEKYRKTNRNTE